MSYSYNPPTGHTPATTRRDLEIEFRRWNQQAGEMVIPDYALPMYQPGAIAAAVVFSLRGQRVEMRIDRWPDFATNLRAAYLNIRDMRLAEARGGLEGMREALAALPAPARERDPYEVLGVRPDSPREVIDASYRALAKKLHSDVGGEDASMKALNAAYEKVTR